MQGSKIGLSDAERILFADAGVILTKNSILKKTAMLLGDVQQALMDEPFAKTLACSPSPKISKGENYLGLPYVILDYPRTSTGDGLFFIRSMFWWGHFYSSTLQLSGSYKEKYADKLVNAFDALSAQPYFVCTNEDPWQHHFKEDNYASIGALSKQMFTAIVQQQPYIKIAAHWPLSDWDAAANNLVKSWKFLMGRINKM